MAISSSKKVSVIVPNYNYARYIDKRIESIVRQTYPIYELILLDDCSTDNSVAVIEQALDKVREKYPSIIVKFVKNKVNSGKAIAQWKKGFELAKGDFIWIAEADDLCSKHFLAEVMKGFDDSEAVLSYVESAIINSKGIILVPNFRRSRDKEKTGHFGKNYTKDGVREIEEIMAIRCTIPNVSAVVFRKKAIRLKDLERAIEFKQVGDWYLYTKILENGQISYSKKALNKFRVHSGSKTAESKKNSEHYKEVLWMHEYFKKNYHLSKRVIDAIGVEEARVRRKHGIIE